MYADIIFRCVGGSSFLIEDLDNAEFDYTDLGCADWPAETVDAKKSGVSCSSASNSTELIEIGFAVGNNFSNKVLITSCLDQRTYQSLWSRHEVPKVIDQRNYYGDMPYFSDDGLYDFQLEVYKYYTKDMQRYDYHLPL